MEFLFFILIFSFRWKQATTATVRGRYDDIEGTFCESRRDGCCAGRNDECTAPILNHVCYCDDFCDGDDFTIRQDHDCCPDFSYVCQGGTRPEPVKKGVCYHEGTPYDVGDSRKDNCNECKCEQGNGAEGTWTCETKPCLIVPTVLDAVNGGPDYTWKATNYTEFWGRPLSDGITYRLGTLLPENAVYNMRPIRQIYDPSTLPNGFDARENPNWPNYIQQISDQGWCGSDWAVSTVAVTADRLAIQTKGVEVTKLAAQHLLSCDPGQLGCEGGHLDRAWNFMRQIGIVDEDCYPYTSGRTGSPGRCEMTRRASLHDCRSSNPPGNRTQLYKTGPSYRISKKEDDIKFEILTYGPVQAVMEVSADFFMYRSGIYRKTRLSTDSPVGFHSVRILGWGEEYRRSGPVKYWIIANSWGNSWGENGVFRIRRGENECDIEKFVIAAWAKPANEDRFVSDKEFRSLTKTKQLSKWDKF